MANRPITLKRNNSGTVDNLYPTTSTNQVEGLDTLVASIAIDELNDISDVNITSPTSGQVLKYNGTNWVNGTDNEGSGGEDKVDKSGDTMTGQLDVPKVVLGDVFTPTSSNETNILNILVGGTSDGSANGIKFYENTGGYGMSFGYDGSGSGTGNKLAWYTNTDTQIMELLNTAADDSLRVNGKVVSLEGHTHSIANVTGLQDALDAKATPSDISTAVSNLVNGADAAFDTLKEIQDAMATDTELSDAIAGLSIPSNTSDLNNDSGFITGINSSDVTTALGYTPYDSTNPNGYTSNVGDITAVSAGTGLSGGGTSGNVTLNLDFTELTDITLPVSGSTEMVVKVGFTEGRKALSEIDLSAFNNDAGWTSNAGDITSITAGTALTGGGTSGGVTLNVDASEINTSDLNNDAGWTSNVGDITSVTTSGGLTGGGTSGSVNVSIDTSGASNGDILRYGPVGPFWSTLADSDDYDGWDLYTDGTSRGRISSGENVNFVGGTDISLSYGATDNTITINSTASGGGGGGGGHGHGHGGSSPYYMRAHNAAFDTFIGLNTSTLPTGWVNGTSAGGNHNWSFENGTDTPSNGTGPEGDQTQTGFWFTETSGGSTSDVYRLRYDLSTSTLGVLDVPRRLSFEYSAYGTTQGTFTVYSSANTTADEVIFQSIGDVGDAWLEGRATIPANHQYLFFEVTDASSFTGDVCLCNVRIDDFSDA